MPQGQSGHLFVGRQREVAELMAALEDAMSGRGRLVMLVREPDIGKTRTALELASYAENRGGQVLWGRCFEEVGVPPYWPWVQPIRSYVQRASAEQLATERGPEPPISPRSFPGYGVNCRTWKRLRPWSPSNRASAFSTRLLLS